MTKIALREPIEYEDPYTQYAKRAPLTNKLIQSLNGAERLRTWGYNMAEQVERAFLKQPTIKLNSRARILAGNKRVPRYVRNIGLGFKTPHEASQGSYIDKKCPWTGGNCAIRGNILTGVVLKNKMTRTIDVQPHCSPAFRDIAPGDLVTIGECRPLSKTVRFNVLKFHKSGSTKKGFAKF
ncbi:unnamed protein product [Heligmosomoides polygyrus]|uniref:Small ribosomal subunit protein uS17 n=1 Tax=Heligmosomoides polygyrus TaxID=6339 RepID=A0A183G3Z6_HELPZ|nr:unnamed protein product [Heligmosomoides polygyrus]